MIKIENPVILNLFAAPGHVLRLVVAILLLGNLAACAVSPTQSSDPDARGGVAPKAGLAAAADMYNSQNYTGAITEFGDVIGNSDSSANNRRLAHLGKALVYLSDDAQWHSIENAKMALVAAGRVAPAENEEFPIETDMLMDAVSAVIGSESKYVVLQRTSADSRAEFKRQRNELTAERDELLADQKALNEALEKLKQLTLGN